MGEERADTEAGKCAETSTMENSMLRRAIDLISSPISLSYNVRVFSGRWQMIRTKLEELNGSLEAAENWQAATESSTYLLDLVESILQTLGRCQDLANQCVNVSYNGKLLMQSELDLACAKLDAHIRSLAGLYAAGVLSNRFAMVISKPCPSASRDDLRFYVRDLATRMKIGDSEALGSLHELIVESEKCVGIAMEEEEIVCMLPKFLDSPATEIQEESARVSCLICGLDSYKGLLVGAGIIPPSIRVSEGGSTPAKEYAVKSLLKLTENSNNAWAVAAHGGVTALLNILLKSCASRSKKDDDNDDELISSACGVMRNLVGVEEIKRFMVEEGAIPAFIKLVNAGNESTQISSMEFLQAMAYGDESLGRSIVTQGSVGAMISSVLDPSASSSSYKARAAALKAVESLCFSSHFELLVSSGFVAHLLFFLQNGEPPMQELAFKAAARLCGASDEAQKTMGDLGFIPEFVGFLQAKSCEIRSMAAEALSYLLVLPKNKKRFLEEDGNIGLVLQLLQDSNQLASSELVRFLLSILLALSSSAGVRRRILKSACFSTVEKLAQSGVRDAKKVIRKSSSNRFQFMVSRILHFDG